MIGDPPNDKDFWTLQQSWQVQLHRAGNVRKFAQQLDQVKSTTLYAYKLASQGGGDLKRWISYK